MTFGKVNTQHIQNLSLYFYSSIPGQEKLQADKEDSKKKRTKD